MKRTVMFILMLMMLYGVVQAKQEPYVEAPDEDWGGIEDPFVLPDNLLAHIVFGRFDNEDDVDAFSNTLEVETGVIPVTVMIPECDAQTEAASPVVAIIGAGLDIPDEPLPFELPDGMGAQILQDPVQSDEVTNWADYDIERSERYMVEVPEGGSYLLAVWEADGQPGVYMIETLGAGHAMDENRSQRERDATFRLIDNRAWMGDIC